MSSGLKQASGFEYNSNYRMLVVKAYPADMKKFTDYILLFFSLFKEVELNPVENIIIYTPDFPVQFISKMHYWFNNYILPQLTHLDVCRIALVTGMPTAIQSQGAASATEHHRPAISKFSSLPEAKAWIIGLISKIEPCCPGHSLQRIWPGQRTG